MIQSPTNSNMDTTKPVFFFFFFMNFIFTRASASDSNCFSSFCRQTEPKIRFPFRLQSHQPPTCGYPGFDLFCDAFNRTLIDLPNSGNLTVQSIDYSTQNIWLNDPDNCLPKRLLGLNLSGSPFRGYFFQEFTLFNCSSSDYSTYLNPIGCLSGEGYSVFASSSRRGIDFLQSRCSFVATVAVPVQWNFYEPVVTSDLSDDIRLTWGWPRCRRCESRGGRCGFRDSNSTQIVCTKVAHRGLSKSARIALIVCAGLPALLCLTGFLCFLCGLAKNYSRRRAHPIIDQFSIMGGPRPITTVSGLDRPTIESYPKTILGESRRLPMPDHNICSICLSEYMPNETLRTIPDCQHCFHAECIDEWLTRNASCPVCRKSPMLSPVEQHL